MLKITVSNPKLGEALKAKSPRVVQMLSVALNKLLFQLETKIRVKLSGEVLKVRTGVLRSSVHAIPAELKGPTSIVGIVESSSGPSFYGKIHEHGGVRPYEIFAVNQRALSFLKDGRRVFAQSVQHPPLAARPFMSTALAEEETRIREELNAAIQKVIHED